MTSDTADETTTDPSQRTRWLGDVGFYVDLRVGSLFASLDRSATVATMSRLRRGLGREPGDDPGLWAVTLDRVPGQPRGGAPTFEELAVHAALTLYAAHQQTRVPSMHEAGVGLGQAVARLNRARPGSGDGVSPVRRRFDAAVTSATLTELTHHLRGLVAQLRGESITLDYGALADDLFQFQLPGTAPAVRRRWGRQLYHLEAPAPRADRTDPAQTDQTDQTDQTLTEENR